MNPRLQIAVPALVVLGLLFGPMYYAWCVYGSGETVKTIPMTDRAERWVTADGTILRFRGGLGYRPQTIDLAPDMNLVKLRLRFEFPNGARPAGAQFQYQATLLQFDQSILERSIVLEASRSGTQTIDLGPIEIYYPGAYTLLLEEIGKPQTVPAVRVEVVQKAVRPLMPLVWTGFSLIVVGCTVVVWETLLAVRRRRTLF